MQTSGNVVRGVVRSLLAKHPGAKKVGIITHRCHISEIEQLEPFWMERIARRDYFRSGNDRASNAWLNCDLLLVLGTPRVPPSAVRRALIQIGKLKDAGIDGKWRSVVWEGHTLDDDLVQVEGLGYAVPAWAEMHHVLVRSLLLQAVGRGRGVIESGVPVVVVSNEPLGLPFTAGELVPLKDDSG